MLQCDIVYEWCCMFSSTSVYSSIDIVHNDAYWLEGQSSRLRTGAFPPPTFPPEESG